MAKHPSSTRASKSRKSWTSIPVRNSEETGGQDPNEHHSLDDYDIGVRKRRRMCLSEQKFEPKSKLIMDKTADEVQNENIDDELEPEMAQPRLESFCGAQSLPVSIPLSILKRKPGSGLLSPANIIASTPIPATAPAAEPDTTTTPNASKLNISADSIGKYSSSPTSSRSGSGSSLISSTKPRRLELCQRANESQLTPKSRPRPEPRTRAEFLSKFPSRKLELHSSPKTPPPSSTPIRRTTSLPSTKKAIASPRYSTPLPGRKVTSSTPRKSGSRSKLSPIATSLPRLRTLRGASRPKISHPVEISRTQKPEISPSDSESWSPPPANSSTRRPSTPTQTPTTSLQAAVTTPQTPSPTISPSNSPLPLSSFRPVTPIPQVSPPPSPLYWMPPRPSTPESPVLLRPITPTPQISLSQE